MSSKNRNRSLIPALAAILLICGASGGAAAPNRPEVISAAVDYSVNPGVITIGGQNLPSGPNVRLGGILLEVTLATPTQIKASLEAAAALPLPGNYQLSVCDGGDHQCATLFVTVGAPHAAPPCFDNANRYVDCGNGTVTDTVTGLIWLKNANCFATQTYSAANQAAAGLAAGQCGLTDGSSAGDWRLPTKAEWEATIARAVALGCQLGGAGSPPSLTNDPGTGCLSAGPTSFTGVQLFYWSSSANEVNPFGVWSVGLDSGSVFLGGKDVNGPVWPVRGGQ